MTIITKKQITEKVGKKYFLSNDYTLAAKLNYESGIILFDKYLNEKSLKDINAVIHITKYPKGLVFKIAKFFSSIQFALGFSEIQRTLLSEKPETSRLIFETINDEKIFFTLKTNDINIVSQFLIDIKLKHDFETSIVSIKQNIEKRQNIQTKTTPFSKYRK